MNKSTLKTKMRRAGFACSPHHWVQTTSDEPNKEVQGITRSAWRKHWKYCHAHGRNYKVRWHAGVVDISEVYATFDRWANSTERTLSIEDFAKEYLGRKS